MVRLIKNVKSNNYLVSRLIDLFAMIMALTGLVVLIGWIAGIPYFVQVNPSFVNIKLDAAFKFVLAGVLFCLLNRQKNNDCVAQPIGLAVCAISAIIGFLTLVVLFAHILGLPLEKSAGFIGETAGVSSEPLGRASEIILSIFGVPPIPGMISFLLVSIAGLLLFFHRGNKNLIFWMGGLIIVFGMVAIIGYAIKTPALYYYIEGVSTGMAFHGAILFVLMGVELILLNYKTKKVTSSGSRESNQEMNHDYLLKLNVIVLIFLLLSLFVFVKVYSDDRKVINESIINILVVQQKINEEHTNVTQVLQKIIEADTEIVKKNNELIETYAQLQK